MIGIIGGTGEEGKGIALRLGREGQPVVIGSRTADKASRTAREVNQALGAEAARGALNQELPERCRILFLTVPFQHAANTLEALAERLDERHLVVDVTVPLAFGPDGPSLRKVEEGSGAERLRATLPARVPLAAAFKTLPAHLLCDIEQPLDCDEFVCADRGEARQRLLPIVGRIPGIRWIDAGPLRYCRALEAMTMLAVGLNRRYKSREGRFRVVGID